jgi:hypothetical protein
MRREFLWPPEAHTSRPGALSALPGAGADQGPLELGEAAQDGEGPVAIIVAAPCVLRNEHRGRFSAWLLG